MDLSKTFCLVTGGSRGIGKEVCRRIVSKGGRVLLTARNYETAKKEASRISKEFDREGHCLAEKLDLLHDSSINDLVTRIELEFNQKVNVLVNNAGIMLHDWTDSAFNDSVQVNFKGTVTLTEKLLPFLTPGGTIVNISTSYGEYQHLMGTYKQRIPTATDLDELAEDVVFDPNSAMIGEYVPTYKVSKAMLNRATELLAHTDDLVDRGLSINAISPGWCRTDMGGSDAPLSAEDGADMAIWMIEHARPRISGGYYKNKQKASFSGEDP